MAANATLPPQSVVGGSEFSGGNRGRRRHHGRGRGGGAPRGDQEDIDPSSIGHDAQQQQQQQQQPGGRQRARRSRGPRGDAMGSNSQDAPLETQGQPNHFDQSLAAPRPPRQRHRRGRGGGNGGTINEVSGHQAEQPQQLNWQQQLLLETTQQQPHRSQAGGSRGGRGGGRGRGGQQHDRNRRQPQEPSTTPSRPSPAPRNDRAARGRITAPRGFGAQLTVAEPVETPTASGHPRSQASSFEPGASVHKEVDDSASVAESSDTEDWDAGEMAPISTFQSNRKTQAHSAATVKEAEDLMTRIHKGIASGNYECMICYGGVTRKSQVWDCGRCYAVFHLKCIQKWAKQGLNAPLPPNALQNGDEQRKTWRCPGCQNPDSELPTVYECWCGKTQTPEVQRYIAPHSCGQPCGKERISPRACPHPCNLQCHAGPCPPCTAMGPIKACFCGKESTQRRCLDTDYENGWSCQQICNDLMPCGQHTCPKPCHSGSCGDCEFEEELHCYCGKQFKDVRCCDKGLPLKSTQAVGGEIQQWIGHWSCKTECERFFDCGKHKCIKPCHAVDPKPAHCPLSPDKITHCPCGKTKLTEIIPTPRQSCEEPIPSCNKPCNKTLKCGHKCQETCHTDDCGVCLQTMEVSCRCGRTSSSSLCHQGDVSEPPQCMRTCRVMLNCQRHECGEKCCSGESAAMERIAASKKKKQRPLNSAHNRSDEGYEPEHICTRVCGKLLKCGKHPCPMLCHRGPCGTCLEASFEELACNCGRTIIHPPVPCGSRPPQCAYECTREKACGHPRTPHNCHIDEEPCPKCPYLTIKRCVCGKKDVKNQPCWRDGVTCGTICGKKLSCGSHTCKKVCHKDGECDEPCTQACGKPKSCGHMDTDACHAPFQCTETTPCQSKLQISCACGGIKQEVKCNATKSSPGNKTKEIKCNDACRARRMALALQIDPERESADKMGYSDETIEMYNQQPKQFTQSIEKALRTFADASQKRFAFQPMKSQLRQFIHLLAADFGLESESQDPEPYRSVVVMKGPKFTTAPKKTIAEFIRSSAKPSVLSSHAPSPAPTLIEQLRKPSKQAVNAIVLEGIRIGLLMNELEKELDSLLGSSQLKFNIHWTSDEEVVLEPKPSSFGMEEIELELSNIKAPLRRALKAKGLANEVELCWVGKDGKIVHKENQKWATVVGPKGGSSSSTPTWGGRPGIAIAQNGYGALDPSSASASRMVALGGGRSSSESLREKERKEREKREKEKKKVEEEIVDDWEAAADEEEARSVQAEGSVKGEEQEQEEEGDAEIQQAQSTCVQSEADASAATSAANAKDAEGSIEPLVPTII